MLPQIYVVTLSCFKHLIDTVLKEMFSDLINEDEERIKFFNPEEIVDLTRKDTGEVKHWCNNFKFGY